MIFVDKFSICMGILRMPYIIVHKLLLISNHKHSGGEKALRPEKNY